MKRILKKYEDTGDPKVRSAVGRLSGLVGIVSNVLLCIGKLAVGTISGSVSITADAMNNLSDASSSVMTLVGFYLSEKPADANHPYGHARFEYLSGLAVAAAILLIGFELCKTSVLKIFNPTQTTFSWVVLLVLAASIGVKFCLSLFQKRLGQHIDSAALMAAAADSRNDVIATLAVLGAALVEALFHWRIDGFAGLAVALFIMYSGAAMAKETISPLLGEAASPELREVILRIIRSEPKVVGFHDLMVHDYGPGQRFASLHVEMDQNEDPLVCHELIDNLERECLEKNRIHLVIHYDPVVRGDAELDRLQSVVLQLLCSQDSRITLHDFRMVPGGRHTNLVFDVALPADRMAERTAIKQRLDAELAQAEPGKTYYTVITFDLSDYAR